MSLMVSSIPQALGILREVGSFTLEKGMDFAKLMADPEKGYMVSLASYYLLHFVSIDVSYIENTIEGWAKSIEEAKPYQALRDWVSSVTGLTEADLFNIQRLWETTPPTPQACEGLNIGCYIVSGLQWVAKAIVFPFRTLGIWILWGIYYLVFYAWSGIAFTSTSFLRYILKPLASLFLSIVKQALKILRFILCIYISFATYIIPLRRLARWIGKDPRRGLIEMVASGLLAFTSTLMVAPECSNPVLPASSIPAMFIDVSNETCLSFTSSLQLTVKETYLTVNVTEISFVGEIKITVV
ncbi:MAG: hypothetical protein C0179_00720 [Fervidicoccus sp.]|nr:MAG: hypothetical protein C0179_00720 [Fervidicoccus sp.]